MKRVGAYWPDILFVLVILAVVGALVADARAHGDADWIRQGGYTDARGLPCCGVTDCAVLPVSHIERTGDYYVITTAAGAMLFPVRQAHPSIDEHYWLCAGQGRVKCVFVPGTVS